MNEEDIRKREIFDRYLEMVKEDIFVFFSDKRNFVEIPCQACGTRDYAFQFNKAGFDYVLCNVCSTLFVNPRPNSELLAKFYVESPSTSFWVNDFFKPVAEARREKIFRPRAEYLARKYGAGPEWIIGDIGSGFGLFLEELSKIWGASTLIAIEPSKEMSEICRSKAFEVLPCAFEEVEGWNEKFDLLTSFELFEHVFEPHTFLEKAWELLRPEGRLFLTTLNGKGFDIQVLWEKSKSVAPPHHLNFFNPRSIGLLLEKTGFIVEEISTPGELDWDIVEGMIRNDNIDAGRFCGFLADEGTTMCKREFQEWISRNNLSSHMRVIARKGKGLR
jgi:SAM-dependent methyltransferase